MRLQDWPNPRAEVGIHRAAEGRKKHIGLSDAQPPGRDALGRGVARVGLGPELGDALEVSPGPGHEVTGDGPERERTGAERVLAALRRSSSASTVYRLRLRRRSVVSMTDRRTGQRRAWPSLRGRRAFAFLSAVLPAVGIGARLLRQQAHRRRRRAVVAAGAGAHPLHRRAVEQHTAVACIAQVDRDAGVGACAVGGHRGGVTRVAGSGADRRPRGAAVAGSGLACRAIGRGIRIAGRLAGWGTVKKKEKGERGSCGSITGGRGGRPKA